VARGANEQSGKPPFILHSAAAGQKAHEDGRRAVEHGAVATPERTMKARNTAIAALILGVFGAIPAGAASIANKDKQSYLLKITEGGQQSEIGVAPGQTVDVCASGCFLLMPNGDRETLGGSEKVEIVGGKAVIK
jgi:hypothetical protein